MPREARIVRLVKPRRAACRDKHSTRFNDIEHAVLNADPERAVHSVTGHIEVDDIHAVKYAYTRLSFRHSGEKRLYVFAVYLDIAVSAGDIFTVLVFQDNETFFFKPLCHCVQTLRHREQQVVSRYPRSILFAVIGIILRCSSIGYISIERVHTCGKTAASLDVRLFTDEYMLIRVFRRRYSRVTARSTAADDKYIGLYFFSFHSYLRSFHAFIASSITFSNLS